MNFNIDDQYQQLKTEVGRPWSTQLPHIFPPKEHDYWTKTFLKSKELGHSKPIYFEKVFNGKKIPRNL